MGKRLTYEEVKNFIEGEEGNGCKLISEEYKNNSTKLEMKCKCGNKFKKKFNKFKQGNERRCNKCAGKEDWNYEKVKKFIEIESESGCKLLSNSFHNFKTILELKCKCGNNYKVNFNKFKDANQRQCQKCSHLSLSRKRTKTHRTFIKEVYELVKCEYSVMSLYTRANKHVEIKHNNCGHKYKVKPNNFLCGYRCPKCYGSMKKSTEEFIMLVKNLYQEEYQVLGAYINNSTKIEIKHRKCATLYKAAPANFLRGGEKCPKCHPYLSKTTEEFRMEIYELFKDEYSVLSEYTKASEIILMRHNECAHEWETIPSRLLRKKGCPICKQSKGERVIASFLTEKGVEFTPQFTFPELKQTLPLRFDFAILNNKKIKFLVEYDGEFHFSPLLGENKFEKQKINDKMKNDYCLKNSIPLIRIPYWERDNIQLILTDELNKYGLV